MRMRPVLDEVVLALPDFAQVDQTITALTQALAEARRHADRGVITEAEWAWDCEAALQEAVAALTAVLAGMRGQAPDHPWPVGTLASAPRHGAGVVIRDDSETCWLRIVHDVVAVPAAQCTWDWSPTPTTVALAHEVL